MDRIRHGKSAGPVMINSFILLQFGIAMLAPAGDWHLVKTKKYCNLPDYDYRTSFLTNPRDRAISTVGVMMPISAGLTNRSRETTSIRLFQLSQPNLKADHCELRQLSMLLEPTGRWSLSMRAIHHPRDPATGEPKLTMRGDLIAKQTFQLKRNQFVIKVRAFGAMQNAVRDLDRLPGRPVLFEVERSFWVENGEPITKQLDGVDSAVQRYFSFIDRMEVEFTYR